MRDRHFWQTRSIQKPYKMIRLTMFIVSQKVTCHTNVGTIDLFEIMPKTYLRTNNLIALTRPFEK